MGFAQLVVLCAFLCLCVSSVLSESLTTQQGDNEKRMELKKRYEAFLREKQLERRLLNITSIKAGDFTVVSNDQVQSDPEAEMQLKNDPFIRDLYEVPTETLNPDSPPKISIINNRVMMDSKMYSSPTCASSSMTFNEGLRPGMCQYVPHAEQYGIYTIITNLIGTKLHFQLIESYFQDSTCSSPSSYGAVTSTLPINTCIAFDSSYIRLNPLSSPPTSLPLDGMIKQYFPTRTTCEKNKQTHVKSYDFTAYSNIAYCFFWGESAVMTTCRDGIPRNEYFYTSDCSGEAYFKEDISVSCNGEGDPVRQICVGNHWYAPVNVGLKPPLPN